MASCPAVTADLQEHLGLQRHLAELQARVSKQMAALVDAEARARACAEAAEHRCAAMERALIKERSRAVLACTRWAWDMGGPPPPAVASTPDPAHARRAPRLKSCARPAAKATATPGCKPMAPVA